MAKVRGQVLVPVGNVLGQLGKKVERAEDLEVAVNAGESRDRQRVEALDFQCGKFFGLKRSER